MTCYVSAARLMLQTLRSGTRPIQVCHPCFKDLKGWMTDASAVDLTILFRIALWVRGDVRDLILQRSGVEVTHFNDLHEWSCSLATLAYE